MCTSSIIMTYWDLSCVYFKYNNDILTALYIGSKYCQPYTNPNINVVWHKLAFGECDIWYHSYCTVKPARIDVGLWVHSYSLPTLPCSMLSCLSLLPSVLHQHQPASLLTFYTPHPSIIIQTLALTNYNTIIIPIPQHAPHTYFP